MSQKSWFARKVQEVKNKGIGLLWLLFAGFWIWILFQLLYAFYGFSFFTWIQTLPYVYDVFQYFSIAITSKSDIGMFYLFLFSSLFFLPIPLEVLYLTLATQIDPTTLATYAVLGIMAGQVINYWLGRGFSIIFRSMLKKSTQKKAQEKLAKYGGFAIVTMHTIPFPFQLFNTITGLFKYPFLKWLLYATIGILIKHVILIAIALNV